VLGDREALTTPPNVGDALALTMALVAALCVQLVARFAPREDPVGLNGVQIFTMSVLSSLIAWLVDGVPPMATLPIATWLSLLYLAVFATGLAFLMQFFGQRHLSPTPATTIMLLETPIGVVAGMGLLDEIMDLVQWLGAALAASAVVLAVRGEPRVQAREHSSTSRGVTPPRTSHAP